MGRAPEPPETGPDFKWPQPQVKVTPLQSQVVDMDRHNVWRSFKKPIRFARPDFSDTELATRRGRTTGPDPATGWHLADIPQVDTANHDGWPDHYTEAGLDATRVVFRR